MALSISSDVSYKLATAAEKGWRRLNNHQLLTHVLAGETFVDGELKVAA